MPEKNRLYKSLLPFFFLSIIIFFVLLYVPNSTSNSSTHSSETIELGTHYNVFRDPTNAVTIHDIVSGEMDSSFVPSTEKYLSFWHTDDTIWLKLIADDVLTKTDQNYWLEYDDKVEVMNMYVVREDGSFELTEGGLLNVKEQQITYHSFLYEIENPSSVTEIYLQIEGQLPLTIFTTLYSTNGLIENVMSYKFYTGTFYGFLTALLVYNLFLYVSFKDRSYLYYSLYMFSFMLFQATMNSFDVELLGHVLPGWFFTKTLAVSCSLMVIFMILFGKEFLELKHRLPTADKILNISVIISCLSIVGVFVGLSQYVVDMFITMFSVIVLIFLWFTGLYSLIKGYKSARFYMLGWSILLGSVIIQGLAMLEIIPLSLIIFEEIPSYSAMFEAVILSVALVDKVSIIIKENRQTQEELNEMLELKVTERTKQLENIQVELEHLANTDRLTQVPNRVRLDHVLEHEFTQVQTGSVPLSVIMIDLDYFKSVNDTFGHQVGDYVLVDAARLFTSTIRKKDTLGRWGGEEFLVICPSTPLEDALQLAERLRVQLEQHCFLTVGQKTASFGVASYVSSDSLNSMISRCDKALYKAKENGRNRVEYIKI
ncbi:diguanylate cyclase [Sporosarcina sp. PTS2304]|uniref:sensor domain-containing diguanylate cyclase n=1 Tax=Sporosarcina sp. PTS2304 TaxID=2283194 RepID=UPI001F07ACA4|nr:diguanylate cyclase [Sporosarcina sp. PTS2304]